MNQNHFLSFTIHYITTDWKIVSRVLFTVKFDEAVKTGTVIQNMIVQKFNEYGLHENYIPKIIFVCDEGSNLIAAFKDFGLIHCSLHLLNKILRNAFCFEDDGNLIGELHDNIKNMVKHFKQTVLAKQLPNKLRQSTDVRFNSNYTMYESVYKQHDEIEKILHENELNDEFKMNKTLLKEMIDLLDEFNDAFKEMQFEKKPTLHKVLLWKHHLINVCTAKISDSHSIKRFKVTCKRLLNTEYKVDVIHHAATFLHPHFNDLSLLQPDEIDNVRLFIKNLMKEMNPAPAIENENNEEEPVPKKSRFDSFKKKTNDNNDKFETEIDKYIQFAEMADDEDLLEWWSSRKNVFPLLSKVARKILAVPSSNTSSERNFSSAGRIMEPRRNALAPENLNELLFLHSNLN